MIDQNSQDIFFMQRALELACDAAKLDEVPVGAILVVNNEIMGQGFNCPISTCDPSAHAEIVALRDGAKKIGNYRLIDTVLYVTLEPCMMCVGAIIHARVKRVVFGASDPKTGAIVSIFCAQEAAKPNHKFEFTGGVMASECSKLLADFFVGKRLK